MNWHNGGTTQRGAKRKSFTYNNYGVGGGNRTRKGGPSPRAKVGPAESQSGPDHAQVGHLQEVADGGSCKGRTGAGPEKSKPGLETSTTGAQRTLAAGTQFPQPDSQLSVIVETWNDLLMGVREAVVVIIDGYNSSQGSYVLNVSQ